MKLTRFLGVLCVLLPCVSGAFGASDFQSASQLLSAARRGDIQTVQILINRGADVNYTDATGLSLVCTAVMNNDTRAIQVLQMYGADASKCDRQIKNYKQKTRVAARGEEYGFFSGLSSSHILALSALGIAGVIGGVALLTDVFDSGSGNSNPPSGGSHSGSGSGGGGSGSTMESFAIPQGPAYLDSAFNINTALSSFGEANSADFNYLRTNADSGLSTANFISDGLNPNLQNYLLVMRGYYPIVSGYLGQNTFRDSSTNAPLMSSNLFDDVPLQGQPARVALITGNGINPAGSAEPANGIKYVVAVGDTQSATASKYFNTENAATEDKSFDFSGIGSVFNPYANVNESALAKIVAGWEAGGRANGDLYGFVPNAQLTILRTGNGTEWKTDSSAVDSDDPVFSAGTEVTIDGSSYKYTIQDVTDTITVGTSTYKIASNSKMFLGKCVTTSGCDSDIAIYVGADGYLYVNSSGGNTADAIYYAQQDSGNGTDTTSDDTYTFYTKKTKQSASFTNFQALRYALTNVPALDAVAMVNVLDNSRNVYYTTVKDFAIGTQSSESVASSYQNTINYYYDIDKNNPQQGGYANSAFLGMAESTSKPSTPPMIIMPAGDYLAETPIGTKYAPLDATFENYAPLIYQNTLNHNFMTVVAVNNKGGTSGVADVTGYGDGVSIGKLMLSQWADSDGNAYISRKCGLTGTGNGSMDPWCFAASGPTAEMATAAAAGAVTSVKSAFTYMSNDQIFKLLALTAEGPFLKTDDDGKSFNAVSLATYLDKMYDLPAEKTYDVSDPDSALEYLAAFQDVFGYGLINLRRAIEPGYSIYYYSDGKIVSDSGDAFWGNVSTNTSRSSTALSLSGRNASVKTAFFDVVESADGSMSLPRVWNMEFALNNDSKSSLYMGDVLADFAVDSTNKHSRTIGDITFDMAMSPRAYTDNFNGLDNLKVAFSNEKYDLDAGYQRHLTDGQSRFDGRANGVLSLVSNGMSSGAAYKYGNFKIGARAFSGLMSDENLLENDPALSSQYEPMRLGLANGGAMNAAYVGEKFDLNISVGNMHENRTVLGALNDGFFAMNGADTQYVDTVMNYKPFEKVNLFARATFANTDAKLGNGMISEISNIKSNSFAIGSDIYGFNFTAAMPLAVVDGRAGYDYADLSVVEQNGKYTVAVNNPHTEYIDLSAQKRELRFSGSYKQSLGEFTDAGVGFIYRVNPGNTDVFGNESIFMLKIHHRLGI